MGITKPILPVPYPLYALKEDVPLEAIMIVVGLCTFAYVLILASVMSYEALWYYGWVDLALEHFNCLRAIHRLS